MNRQPTDTVLWQATAMVDGRLFRWGRDGDDYVAEWSGLLVVRADKTGEITALVPAAGAPESVVQKLASGPAAAFARSMAGKLSMHGSGVALGSSAILCIGQSGAGKSTAASGLCEEWIGGDLLADDVAGLDCIDGDWWLNPSESAHWLEEPGGGKLCVPARRCGRPSRLRCVAALSFESLATPPTIRRLRGPAAIETLLPSVMRFSLAADVWLREFEVLTSLEARVPIFEVARSRETSARATAETLRSLAEGRLP